MTTPRLELEAALAASLVGGAGLAGGGWDRDTLAVYADHLQAEGDPRGELIALDLELATRSTPELVMRRTSLLTGWLGRLVPSDPHAPWIGDSFRLGFVENLVLDGRDPMAAQRLETTLQSPLAPYLKRVTIRGDAGHASSMMVQLATTTHAWLSELTLSVLGGSPIDPSSITALIAATPLLAAIDVSGDNVLASFPHPSVKRVRVSGSAAMPALFEAASPMPAVAELDFGFDIPDDGGYTTQPTGAIRPFVLPALRILDLSRNDTGERGMAFDDPEIDYDPEMAETAAPVAIDLLSSQPIRRQLTHIKLPVLRTQADFESLEVAMVAMDQLLEVEIVRGHYFRAPELSNPRVRFVRPSPWPWPRADRIPTGDSLHVLVPGSRTGDTIPIADVALVMERRFEDLDADARYAWTRFWVFVAELDALPWKRDPHRTWTPDRTFPAELLVTALETCEIGGSGGWRELRDELRFRRPLPAGAMLTVHRVRTLSEG